MILTEKDKREFILLNEPVMEFIWHNGYKCDEAKQVEKYFKDNRIISISYSRADLIRRLLKMYVLMINKNEITRPLGIFDLPKPPNELPEIISPESIKKIMIVKEKKYITIPKNYDKAEQFLKENYFKRDL